MQVHVIRRRTRRAALVAGALIASAVAAPVADAGHTIQPGYYPSQVNPRGTLHWGIPGPEALRSDSFTACTTGTRPGTRDLGNYINYWYGSRRTDYYNCRGTSLHGEGRAFDYFVNKNDSTEKAIGDSIFSFFRRSDTGGAAYMPMRRFGVQEVIWNCRIYSASNMTVRTYFRCDPNSSGYSTSPSLRHEDHVHIGLNKAGAERQRTAWSGYRPCWSGHSGCPQ